MKSWLRLPAAIALVAMGCLAHAADVSSGIPGGNIGYNAAVASLLAHIPAFSADVETALTNLVDNSRMTIPMRMLKREGKLRIEVDFVKIKGADVALQGLSAMQNIGMARMTSLVTPQEKGMFVLFPDLKSFTRVNLSDADLQEAGSKLSKRPAGKDTIDGQSCVRQLVTLMDAEGKKVEATAWEAPGLSNFPVRMFFKQKDGAMTMTYRKVNLNPPAEELFRVPEGYQAFDNMSSLMQEAMTRVLPPGPGVKRR